MAKKRVTLVMEEDLDQKVEIFSAVSGRRKNELISTAITDYLEGQSGYAAINRTLQKLRSGSEPEQKSKHATVNSR